MSRFSDVSALLKGMLSIAEAAMKIQTKQVSSKWRYSNVRSVLNDIPTILKENSSDLKTVDANFAAKDSAGRFSTVPFALTELIKFKCNDVKKISEKMRLAKLRQPEIHSTPATPKKELMKDTIDMIKVENLAENEEERINHHKLYNLVSKTRISSEY